MAVVEGSYGGLKWADLVKGCAILARKVATGLGNLVSW